MCYFAIISTRSTFTKMANYPGTKLVGVAYKLRKKMKNSPSSVDVLHKDLKFGHFTLLFCRGRQRNVPKCKTHVQSGCFYSLHLLFCGVVVDVAVVVLKLPIFFKTIESNTLRRMKTILLSE